MSTTNKAIFVGSLAKGFKLAHIVSDEKVAADLVGAYTCEGYLAEALDIEAPPSSSQTVAQEYGQLGNVDNFYVVMGTCLGSCHEMIGPFADNDTAVNYAENESESDNWNVWLYDAQIVIG